MKTYSSIQFKAAFLTFVFLLNTIVGFACAVGTDMGFNREHHQDQKMVQSSGYTHKGNEAHDHASHKHDTGHKNKQHEHKQAAADHHAPKKSKDNCCKDQVEKLTKADKLHQSSFDYSLLSLPSFILPVAVQNFGGTSGIVLANVSNSNFVRHCRPPIPDVRIAIQSFQI